MTPRSWLLLLFGGAEQPLDRVRIQKAMFLFAQRSAAPEEEKYRFRPYHYGPFSSEIYGDLDVLVSQGFLRDEIGPSLSSPAYSLTHQGRAEVIRLTGLVPEKRSRLLHDLRHFVTSRTFNQLLTDIYRLYPEYAKRSVFR